MDEMPPSFDMPSPVTIEKHGAKTVGIKTTRHERTNFTVILGYLTDGMKLPAMCIFKLKTILHKVFPLNVIIIIRVNEKWWYNEHEMHYWINNIWTKCSELAKPQSLLVLDSFRGYLVDSVKYCFKENNTHLAVIYHSQRINQ